MRSWHLARRSAASAFASTLLAAATLHRLPARAIDVPQRTEQQRLEQQLYAPPPRVEAYRQQLSDAILIKSLRGVWSLRETFKGKHLTAGILTFRGAEGEDKGQVTYEGEAASGRGPWVECSQCSTSCPHV